MTTELYDDCNHLNKRESWLTTTQKRMESAIEKGFAEVVMTGGPTRIGIMGGHHLGKATMIATLSIPSMQSRNPLHWPLKDGESLAEKIKKDIVKKHDDAIKIIEDFETFTTKQKDKQ